MSKSEALCIAFTLDTVPQYQSNEAWMSNVLGIENKNLASGQPTAFILDILGGF
jgi:hypothetical protein